MSIRLRDLIKAVRSCKTAAQERDVIAKEAAALRAAFRDDVATGGGGGGSGGGASGGGGVLGGGGGSGVGALFRHRNVAKLMYMHMLGYPSHFGQMEALKLVASPGFAGKRIGYLALAVLLDERQEVLMLVTNSLKNDLNSADQYVVGLALAALAAVASKGMAVDLAPEVARLCCHSSAYVRKKATAAGVRLLSRAPEEVVATFADVPVALVGDRHHGVVLAGCSLARAVACTASAVGNANGDEELRGVAASYARELTPTICRALRGLLAAGGGATEHDAAGVCDPFLQVALLRLLRTLWELAGGSVRPGDADAAADVVAAVAASTDAGLPAVSSESSNTNNGAASSPSGKQSGSSRRQQQEQQLAPGTGGGAAVLYEAARTALALAGIGGGGGGRRGAAGGASDGGFFGKASSSSFSTSSASASSASAAAAAASRLLADGGASLRVLAVGILGRFLSSRDGNLRYVALDALSRVAAREPAAVQRHRSTVVACVRDGDAATRRAALELVCALASRGNAAALARELTDYLPLADAGFRPVLAARICEMARRHAGGPENKRWLVEVTLKVLAALGGGGGSSGSSSSSKKGVLGGSSSFSSGAACHIDESVPRSLVVTITNAPELHAFVARALYKVLAGAVSGEEAAASAEGEGGGGGTGGDSAGAAAAAASAPRLLPAPALLRVAVWVVGEYSDLLLASPPPNVLEGEELDEVTTNITAAVVARTLERVLAASASSVAALSRSDNNAGFPSPFPAVDVRATVLTALAKLAARSGGEIAHVVGVEGSFARSADVEVQTRACEYGALLSCSSSSTPSSLASAVLERLPPLDEAAHDAALDVEPVTEEEAAAALATSVGGGGAAGSSATTADSLLGDLMSLEVPVASSRTAAPGATAAAVSASSSSQPAAAAGADALADIFGSVDLLSATTPAAAAAPTAAAAAAPSPVPSPPSKTTPLPEDLFAAPAQEAPAAAAATALAPATTTTSGAAAVLHSTTALSDPASGLVLTLAFSKPAAAASPEDTVVLATATRKGVSGSEKGGAITNFSLQAAVPKYAKLRLDPASGATLEAGGGEGGANGAIITQRLHLTNTAHGLKPLALRLRVSWTPPPGVGDGEPRLEMVEVKDLPATL